MSENLLDSNASSGQSESNKLPTISERDDCKFHILSFCLLAFPSISLKRFRFLDIAKRDEQTAEKRKIGRENIVDAQKKQKIRYDLLHAPKVPHDVGDDVLLKNSRDDQRKGGKLNEPYKVSLLQILFFREGNSSMLIESLQN